MKKKQDLIVSYILLGIFILCTVYTLVSCSRADASDSNDIYGEMQSRSVTEVESETKTALTGTPETSADSLTAESEMPNPAAELIPADKTVYFQTLWDTNTDIYAYIYIPNTNVDYPVLRHPSDNAYYLEHNIDGSKGLPGCIYTENYNSIDFDDPVTLMYGHNMKNGSMFATLHNFEEPDFFNENRYVFIYTPYDTLVYEVFAAVTYNDKHIMKAFDFRTEKAFASFMESLHSTRDMNAHFMDDIEVSCEDNVLVLSTCTSSSDKRFLVCAVLIGSLGD